MDSLDLFFKKYSYKFDKGYPDMNSEKDVLLLESILLTSLINFVINAVNFVCSEVTYSFLVFMYINGNPVDTGWSAGYFDSQGEQQEFLGFSSANVFGESSAVGTSNKLCLAFTEKKV